MGVYIGYCEQAVTEMSVNTMSTLHSQIVMMEKWDKQALLKVTKQIQTETRRLKKEQVSARTIAKLAENVRLLASVLEVIISQTIC